MDNYFNRRTIVRGQSLSMNNCPRKLQDPKYRDIKQSKSDRLLFIAIKIYFKGNLEKVKKGVIEDIVYQQFQADGFTLFKHRVFI
jgi:hypothetical protein